VLHLWLVRVASLAVGRCISGCWALHLWLLRVASLAVACCISRCCEMHRWLLRVASLAVGRCISRCRALHLSLLRVCAAARLATYALLRSDGTEHQDSLAAEHCRCVRVLKQQREGLQGKARKATDNKRRRCCAHIVPRSTSTAGSDTTEKRAKQCEPTQPLNHAPAIMQPRHATTPCNMQPCNMQPRHATCNHATCNHAAPAEGGPRGY
jgi:hypothetical protein